MSIKAFFQKHVETRDKHPETILRTRYYNASYEKAKAELFAIAKEKGYTVKNVNDRYKEAFLETRSHYVIVTFMKTTPLETAIDFKVGMYGLLGLNRPRTIVHGLYDAMSKRLPLKGIGLYA